MNPDKIKKKNLICSVGLIVINIMLLSLLLFYGYTTEDQSIHLMYILISFIFLMNLIYVIYYRKNYKTCTFWLLIIVAIAYIIISLLYIYLINYTYSI